METNPQEIERELSQERTALGQNVAELEHRAKDAVDWRKQFDKSPGLLLGLAFGGGLLLAGLGSSSSSSDDTPRDTVRPSRASAGLERIAAALIAAGATRAVRYLGERVPGFRDEIETATQ